MARRMLINSLHAEECRIAIEENNILLELETERADQIQLKGNIYKSTITRIEPSLQAAFLDIGSNRNGFLQINDIHPAYYRNWPPESSDGKRPPRPSIQDVLSGGQDLIVQVVKDERELKGATLTTNLSIPGRYLVLMVGNQKGGVSRKIIDAGQRTRLRQVVHDLRVPPGMSVIVRTAGINKTSAELQADLDNSLVKWQEIVETAVTDPKRPVVLYQESDIAIRTIRDFLTSDIDEILIDNKDTYTRAKEFVETNMPVFSNRIKYYDEELPIFSKFHLDSQIDATDSPEVTLPSGGSIVIDVAEAIVAIDVNSGRATSQADVEETAYKTNKEAAIEIAKQLRLRDLGGLVVIDFIDMLDKRHKVNVEKTLKDAVRKDKAKVELARISKFGLLEMSRQRLKTSLASQNYVKCPTCAGRSRVKTPEAAALEALRKIESAVCSGGIQALKVRLAPAAALFLLNTKRRTIIRLEESHSINIFVYADGRMKQHEYELEIVAAGRESNIVSNTVSTTRSSERTDNRSRRSRDESSASRQSRGGRDRRSGSRSGSGRGRRNDGRTRGGRGRRSDKDKDKNSSGGRSRGSRASSSSGEARSKSSDDSRASKSESRKPDDKNKSANKSASENKKNESETSPKATPAATATALE